MAFCSLSRKLVMSYFEILLASKGGFYKRGCSIKGDVKKKHFFTFAESEVLLASSP